LGREENDVWDRPQLDSTHIYWTSWPESYGTGVDRVELKRLPREGGDVEVLAVLPSVSDIALSGDFVYARTEEGIQKISKDGRESGLLAEAKFGWSREAWITVDESAAYIVQGDSACLDGDGDARLLAVDKVTGEQVVLAEKLNCPSSLTVDGDYVYLISKPAILRVP
jgi:hypothetical protein